MTSGEIKKKVQDAYVRSLDSNTIYHRSSRISELFRDIKLYGGEAGADFVTTHLDRIVQEAVDLAGCKEKMLEMTVHGFGQAAVEGMAQTLRDLTALKVDVTKWSVKLVWAEANPGLV